MSLRPLTLVVVLVLVAAACGDDAGSTTEPAVASTPATIVTTTTAAPVTTTTTTAATTTTTTVPATTTTEADTHPYYGFGWASIFPDPETRALYRVGDFGLDGDLEAHVEYGVEFGGGIYDRFVFGEAVAGSVGVALYFDFSEPWVVKYAGLEMYTADAVGGPEMSEVYVEPAVFDISGAPGETIHVESTVQARFGSTEFDSDIVADLTMHADDPGSVTVAAGTFDDIIGFDLVLSGPFIGGDFPITCYLTRDNLLLKAEMAGGVTYELLEAWG